MVTRGLGYCINVNLDMAAGLHPLNSEPVDNGECSQKYGHQRTIFMIADGLVVFQ